jgi:hypothetical protein
VRLDVAGTEGTVQQPVTALKAPALPVTAYPDQFSDVQPRLEIAAFSVPDGAVAGIIGWLWKGTGAAAPSRGGAAAAPWAPRRATSPRVAPAAIRHTPLLIVFAPA